MRADPIRLAQNATDNPELEPLLNPAAAFKHPRDVVRDPDLIGSAACTLAVPDLKDRPARHCVRLLLPWSNMWSRDFA
jgi:hypothetical protein